MAEPQPPRLIIKEMIIENFKSYAGPQRVGPFHKNFSAVVGPNGSGKSNVIDAMLFVFGRKASQMRFKKVSELIHNSTHHRNLEMARVSVHFQEIIDKEGDEFDVVPGTEFVVSRTAHCDNKSDYYLNDKKISMQGLTTMLKEKGIDLDNNRFLILQGEVELISQMPPKANEKTQTGFLEYLEDIIGTAQYKPLIDDAAKKLEEFTEKRAQMAQLVKTVEKDMHGLQGKKQQAENYVNTSAEMHRKKIKACRLEIHRSQLRMAKLGEQVAAANARLEEEVKNKEEHLKSFKDSEKQLKALEREYAQAQAAVEAADKRFKDMEREDAKNVEQHKHLKEKIKKVTKKIETDNKALEKMKNESAAMETEIPQQRQQAEETAVQLQEAEQHLEELTASLQPEVQRLNKEASKVRAELAPWEAKMQEVQSRLDVAISERDVLMKKQEDARQRLVDAEKALKAALKSQQEQQQAIGTLKNKLEDSRVRLGDAQRKHANCVASETHLDGVVRELRTNVEGMKHQLNAQRSQSQVIQALMQAKQSGQLPGLYGRLGDLGAIDKKYDIAVSTAVGALDYVVVETAADAQRGVELLRSKNLGVATFLILEKQQHLAAKANEAVQAPEGVPRLFDLVKMQDRRLAAAFYFAMRDTVVADNLEQATRIAYGRDKRFSSVVTLQGELITQAGTMSGGGARPRGGRMVVGNKAPSQAGSQQDARDLATAEEQLARAAQDLESARAATAAAEREIKELQRAVAALELDIPKAEMRAKAEVAKANDLQAQMQGLQGSTQVDAEEAARISMLEQSIASDNQEMAQLQAGCQDLQKKLDAIMSKVENVGGGRTAAAKEAVKNLKKTLQKLEQDITNKTVKGQSNKKQMQKLIKEVGKNETEKAKLEADVVALDERMKAAEEEAVVAIEEKERSNEVFTKKDLVVKEARRQHEERQESVGRMTKEIDELKDEIRSLQKNIKTEEQVEGQRHAKIEKAEGKLRELGVEVDEEMLSEEELACSEEQLNGKINDSNYEAAMKEEQLATMDPDLTVLQEYRAKEADLQTKTAELNAVTQERDEVRKEYEQLRKKRLDEFMNGFNTISLRLKEMYQMITLGGDAELELVDSLDPFSEGIEFSVRPPKKSWKCIANLSGGEKTLSSLSLVFALHHFKPTPLYVMDEIDAALDFRNVSIVGHYIKERTRNAQFVIISLRNNMFELADRMVGIYKTDNCTKSVCINPGRFRLITMPEPTETNTAKRKEPREKEQMPPVAVA